MDLRAPSPAWPRIVAALCLASVVAACATRAPQTAPPAPAAAVHDLHALSDLSERFDRDRDHPRIVLLLSPT